MVVFTCQHCNEALKKPAVEKHYNTKCRRNPYLTCVDCLNDFHGDAYVAHTTCVSEDQRYGGANFVAKAVGVKQNTWFEVVQQCIKNNTNTKYFSIFQRLINAPNVPRKKPKFINFMSNAMNMKNTELAGEIFDLFQKEFEKVNNKKNTHENKDKQNENMEVDATNDKNKHKSSGKGNHTTSESNLEKEMSENGEINDSKKKKISKHKTENGYDGALEVSNENENLENSLTNGVEKKKKKKKSKDCDKENLGEEKDMEDDTNINQEENIDKSLDIPANADPTEKLSKKELKKLRKKQKYEAELKQIEEQQLIESIPESKEDPIEPQTEKSQSKKKKRKANVSESEPDNKKKKEDTKETALEEAENDTNEQEIDVPKKSGKFQWDQVIKELLQNSSDQEMSLKRLSKKVLNEYQAVKGERESYGDLMSKFNKKINKIPGVRILKDKAKLLPIED